MKKIFLSSAYLSLILNVLYLSAWIYIFNNNTAHAVRVEKFNSIIPFGLAVFNLVVMAFSILSIVAFAQYDSLKTKLLIAVQASFLLLYVFQSM